MSRESEEASDLGGSVTAWIGALKANDVAAKRKLWDRYFERLARCARGAFGKNLGVVDEEDIALSALATFFSGAAKGRFPALSDREGLWRLLAFITARK